MDPELLIKIKEKLPTWTVNDNKLYNIIKTKNWTESMSIANMISFLAEKQNHHPDLIVKYGSVTIELFTHTTNNITEKDILLAQKINEVLS